VVEILLKNLFKLGRCISLSKSSALPLSMLGMAMYCNYTVTQFVVIYCVASQLVTLLGRYIHWLCEIIDLHISSSVKLSSMYLISSVKCNCACLFQRLILVADLPLVLVTIHAHRLHVFYDAIMLCAHTIYHLTCGAESNLPFDVHQMGIYSTNAGHSMQTEHFCHATTKNAVTTATRYVHTLLAGKYNCRAR